MSKLFGKEDVNPIYEIEPGRLTREGIAIPLEDLSLEETYRDFKDYVEVASENLNHLQNQMSSATTTLERLQSYKLGSKEHLFAIEHLHGDMVLLSNSLGVKNVIPALEDFSSNLVMRDSHEVAVEGIKDFFVRLWKKIKEIFIKLWKRISLFFKRITGANLDLDNYEKYVTKLIKKIRNDKLEIKDKSYMETKLWELVGDPSTDTRESGVMLGDFASMSSKFEVIINKGFIEKLKRVESSIVKGLESSIKEYSKTIRTDSVDMEEVSSRIASIMEATNSTIINLVDGTAVSVNSIPPEALQRLNDSEPSIELGRTYYSLIEDVDRFSRLPRGFNIHFSVGTRVNELMLAVNSMKDPSEKRYLIESNFSIGVVSSVEDSYITSGEIYPLGSIGELERFHGLYKKFELDVGDLEKLSNRVIDSVTKVMDRASKDFDLTKLVPKSSNQKTAAEWLYELAAAGDRVQDEGGYDPIVAIVEDKRVGLIDYDKYFRAGPDKFAEYIGGLFGSVSDFLKRAAQDEAVQNLVASEKLDISNLDSDLNDFESVIAMNRGLEKTVVKSTDAIKSLLSVVVTDLTKHYTDTKYAAIKYLYDSCRRY